MAPRSKGRNKPSEADLNYASLDLKLAKKRRRMQSHHQGPGRSSPPDQLQGRFTPPLGLEEVDVCLPLRDHSPMVSHSSIYLNSQQIDQEREDNDTMHWLMSAEERPVRWNPEQESQNEVCAEESSNDRRATDEVDTDHAASFDGNQ
ncbi:hypothetical protein WMY93_008493 [Mugilogobius chulae]|uniref:Uncharacterized protein n=1 Tax=Mugilogobius chulae TaxID=88201 RepID=A0AAW0PJB9_9GOBI